MIKNPTKKWKKVKPYQPKYNIKYRLIDKKVTRNFFLLKNRYFRGSRSSWFGDPPFGGWKADYESIGKWNFVFENGIPVNIERLITFASY